MVQPSLVGPHVLLSVFVCGSALPVRLSRCPLALPTQHDTTTTEHGIVTTPRDTALQQHSSFTRVRLPYNAHPRKTFGFGGVFPHNKRGAPSNNDGYGKMLPRPLHRCISLSVSRVPSCVLHGKHGDYIKYLPGTSYFVLHYI